MEQPPPPSLSSTVVLATTSSIPPPPTNMPSSHPESLDSSPKSRTTDAFDDLPPPASSKLRLMCSYNGHILPRPHDKSLCYMGGDTRIVVVDRNSSLSSLITRLSNTLLNGHHRLFTLKYQLPNEDLDSLISVTTDEDLDNMIEEYDRTKPSRLRLFLFTEATRSMGQILESSVKSDDWFLNALNRGFSDSDSDVNRLLGLNDTLALGSKDDDSKQQIQQPTPPQQQQGGGQDVHNLPDSPMLDTSSSSFGSASSSPSLANLPPIRVHVEEAKGVEDQRLGIEEQLARFNVGSDGFAAISSPPPPMPVTISLPAAPANATTDERSEHRRKPPTPRSQPQNPPTHQVKSNSGGHEMPSPDSVSSDSSMNNPVFHQRPSVYQEPVSQMINHPSDPNQNQDSGYILHPQQQQQFIHAPQYLHHHPSTGLPYIHVYPSQPQQQSFHRHPGQLDHQPYPFYYATAPVPPKPFNTPVTQSVSVTDSLAMMPPPPNSQTPGGKPEAGVYATTPQGMIGGAQIVHQVPISQQQFMGYSQIHHPPQQSVSAGIPNYGYEYTENAPKQVYYTQHMGHAQYQTMTGPPPAMVLSDGSAAVKLPAENMTQQIRSSQPL